ncbi:MAG TPA: hypothetical protein VH572_08810 [Gaiella sp.]
MTDGARPAFYALRPGGWRDYVTLLHPPYTLWHLSYVVVGGCLAPSVSWSRLALTVLAFLLALGVGAHALDELAGRPLQTAIPRRVLVGLAVVSVAAACAIGIAVALDFSLWLLVLVAAGAFLVPAYNLELVGGRFHTDLWFGLAWGAFPVLAGYVACAGEVAVETVLAAGWATLLSLAQRRLSTSVRRARRGVEAVHGELELVGGGREPLTREALVAAPEAALRLLTWSTVLVAATLAALRLS